MIPSTHNDEWEYVKASGSIDAQTASDRIAGAGLDMAERQGTWPDGGRPHSNASKY